MFLLLSSLNLETFQSFLCHTQDMESDLLSSFQSLENSYHEIIENNLNIP